MEFLKSLGKGDGSPQNPAQAPNSESTAGASQNAMEFLQGNPAQGENMAKNSAEASTANTEQDAPQAGETGDTQQTAQIVSQVDGQAQDGLQTESVQKTASVTLPAESAAISPAVPAEESVEGTSQNALEYLTGGSAEGQNGNTDTPVTKQPGDTLSIKDLLNAQGVGNPSGTATNPSDNKPEKDSGG